MRSGEVTMPVIASVSPSLPAEPTANEWTTILAKFGELNADVVELKAETDTMEVYNSVLTSTTIDGDYENYLLTVTIPDTVSEELINRYGLKVKMPSGFLQKMKGGGFYIIK